ncbi:MAG: enoyl-CoA hydratase/isomerase family protein [Gammaproteobacteria bacterium]|nr:MAG: enoyl-CoA hydratase/isomerase family protein [Gammaproteobacteria bacterium]RLA56139.1 MAG: enoyl-CoA hydratase/isomerase family protein [Gammaproteobacteria bacterium]HDY83204.1 enoyl-CoA hydratase/isomerase family protein [Halieaceae bacterium]
MSEDLVLYEVENYIATITLNRPHRRNALAVESFDRLNQIFKEIDQNPDVRVAIITGSDCGTFCAGMDLKQAAEIREKEGVDVLSKIGDPSFASMRDIRTPLIAAINGHAPAGGMMLSLNCDLRVAVESATLAITEVHRGRGSPWAMPLFWQMPQSLVTELTLVGDPMPIKRFYDIGYINYLEPTVEKMMERARALAGRIASAAPLSVEAAKLSAMAAMDLTTGHALKEASRLHEKAYQSEDAIEGPRAFAEKRAPVWKGR